MTDPNAVDETRPRLTWEHEGGTVLKPPRRRPHAPAALSEPEPREPFLLNTFTAADCCAVLPARYRQ